MLYVKGRSNERYKESGNPYRHRRDDSRKIYVIRGQRVMLDFELAEIYGYSTSAFNQQVRNNSDKFDDDFRFQLTREEWKDLRAQKSTSRSDGERNPIGPISQNAISNTDFINAANLMSKNLTSSSEDADIESSLKSQKPAVNWGGRRKLPYAFTEQGIYMLMTVLRGKLAIEQSKALIRLFKQMKDFLTETQGPPVWRTVAVVAAQTGENARAIAEVGAGLSEVRQSLARTQETLAEFMAGFDAVPFGREYLVLDGQTVEASVAYQQIYAQAKKSIFIVDNYIGLKTLAHMRHATKDVEVIVFTDNAGKGLARSDYEDFVAEYPDVRINFRKTGRRFHDRFIVIDFDDAGERVYLCGSSSKDSGKCVTVISESSVGELYRPLVEGLLDNPDLKLK